MRSLRAEGEETVFNRKIAIYPICKLWIRIKPHTLRTSPSLTVLNATSLTQTRLWSINLDTILKIWYRPLPVVYRICHAVWPTLGFDPNLSAYRDSGYHLSTHRHSGSSCIGIFSNSLNPPDCPKPRVWSFKPAYTSRISSTPSGSNPDQWKPPSLESWQRRCLDQIWKIALIWCWTIYFDNTIRYRSVQSISINLLLHCAIIKDNVFVLEPLI